MDEAGRLPERERNARGVQVGQLLARSARMGLASSRWRTECDFFNDFGIFALEIANFRSPAGASLGSEGSGGVPRGKVEKGGSGFHP